MKILITVLLLASLRLTCSGQTIIYSLPGRFDKEISQQDYKTIADMSMAAVAKRYKIDSLNNGTIILSPKQDMFAFNLDNLILKCNAESDHSKWPVIIDGHFNMLFNSIDAKKSINSQSYDSIRSNLSIRIYPNSTIEQRGGATNFISRTDLEGTTTLLMLDLPDAFTPVSKKDFDFWHKTIDDVFKEAITNVDKQKIDKVTKVFSVDGVQIEFNFLENEDYAASYALDLSNNSPELVGEWGSVVVIPNKGLVSVCKISKDKPVDFVKYIERIKPLTDKSYTQHPSPVSREFYWYYQGKFTLIAVKTDDKGNINITAPVGLSALFAEKK